MVLRALLACECMLSLNKCSALDYKRWLLLKSIGFSLLSFSRSLPKVNACGGGRLECRLGPFYGVQLSGSVLGVIPGSVWILGRTLLKDHRI